MKVSQQFVKCLENENVEYVFGVPGEENEDIMFALQESSIKFIPTRHEQGAAFMADMWGRLTGKAGVCLATLGPGARYLFTAVADAYLDKAPLVAITGQGSHSRNHHESHQMIDVVGMFSSITKWNGSIQDTSTVREFVRKAFKIAEAEKPGATHIEIPEDIAKMEIEFKFPLKNTKTKRPSPNPTSILQATSLINEASKILILAGNGAIRNRASKELEVFADRHNIPVATTFMGKGAISDRKTQSLGAVGLGFKDYVIEAFQKADLIITIGYDIAEYNPSAWNVGKEKKIIHIDFDPAEVYDCYIPSIEIVGDIASSIKEIDKRLELRPMDNWFNPIRQRIKDSINSYHYTSADQRQFNVPLVLSVLRKHLDDHSLLISDVGSHKMWIARNYPTYCPNGCIISNGLASMGIALPGAISASLVNETRQIVAFMGDGGALMNIQELETANRLGVNVTYIVANDNNYGLIEWKQKESAGKSFGTELGNPDFVKLAESFGIKGFRPKTVGELSDIIEQAINEKGVHLIEIPISTEVNEELTSTLEEYFKI